MHKNFVLRTILEYKKIGFHVRIVYTVNDLGPQGTVNILYGTLLRRDFTKIQDIGLKKLKNQ